VTLVPIPVGIRGLDVEHGLKKKRAREGGGADRHPPVKKVIHGGYGRSATGENK